MGNKTLRQLAHVLGMIYEFIERHFWLYVVCWSVVIAVPVPIFWSIFAFLMSIKNEIIRAVAIWSYLCAIVFLSGIKALGEKAMEKSAVDRALGG